MNDRRRQERLSGTKLSKCSILKMNQVTHTEFSIVQIVITSPADERDTNESVTETTTKTEFILE